MSKEKDDARTKARKILEKQRFVHLKNHFRSKSPNVWRSKK